MFDVDVLSVEVARLLQAHLDDLTYLADLPKQTASTEAIQRRVGLLCQAASGELGSCRDGDGLDENVDIAWNGIYKLLNTSAAACSEPLEMFWTTPLGVLLMHARLWLDCDKLISLSDAATMLRGSAKTRDLVWINDQIKRGRLTRYCDPAEPNPTRAGRVSRNQVELLKK